LPLQIVDKVNKTEGFMEDLRAASEKLAGAWLALSSNVWRNRLMEEMTFHEFCICRLLHQSRKETHNATWLCRRTGILRSQMNRELGAMEAKGYLRRLRMEEDRRQVAILLLPKGESVYLRQREAILQLVDEIVARLGAENAAAVAGQVQLVVQTLQAVFEQKGKE